MSLKFTPTTTDGFKHVNPRAGSTKQRYSRWLQAIPYESLKNLHTVVLLKEEAPVSTSTASTFKLEQVIALHLADLIMQVSASTVSFHIRDLPTEALSMTLLKDICFKLTLQILWSFIAFTAMFSL